MTTSELNAVRPMHWSDIARVHDVEVRAFCDTPWSVESFWSELARMPDTRHYLVAARGEQILGYAGLMTVGPDADIQTLAVAPDARGAGLGAQLLDALLTEARRRGCSRVTLEVASTGEAAQNLYRARGFDVIGRRSGYYGSGVDALIMRRRLVGETPVVENQGTLS